MSNLNPAPPGGVQPSGAPKKTGPLVWILGGIAVFILLLGGAAIIGTYFVVQKARQAGLDTDLMEKNPALAVAKMMTALNPEIEIVSVDDRKGLITIREKKTGKTTTVNFEDAKNGKISFTGENNEKVTIETDSASGIAQVKTAEGTVEFGGSAKMPSWVPEYPGVKAEASYSARGRNESSGSVHFRTKDSIENVVKHYESSLKGAGLKVSTNIMQQDGKTSGGMLTAQDDSNTRTVMVTLGSSGEGTDVNIVFTEKKQADTQ